MNTVMTNLLEVINFHSDQYSLIKQGKKAKKLNRNLINRKILFFLVLVSTKFMELFLTDDLYICPLMINSFEDIVRKSR